jgi:putative hydrolase of the HAD superfamily
VESSPPKACLPAKKRRMQGSVSTLSTAEAVVRALSSNKVLPRRRDNGLVVRCVLLDALGTLVELEPPWPLLAAELGVDVDDAERAMRAEMRYYRNHSHEGRDAESLADLRRRCAEIVSRELGGKVTPNELMAAIRFRAYPDAAPALAELRGLGLRLVCVSNWDVSLPSVLDRCGLADALDAVVTSAAVGATKPDPAIFAAALTVAGCDAGEALHVGDTVAEDVDGARGAGMRGLLIDRDGGGEIESLAAIRQHLGS